MSGFKNQFDKFAKKLDWRQIDIVAGDIPAGKWEFSGSMLTPDAASGLVEVVDLMDSIAKLEVQTQDSVKDLGKTLGLTVAGGVLMGPLGAIAGYFAGGSRKQVCVLVTLNDKRKFLAVMDQRIYQQMMGISMM
jgi:hypothetical protein